MTKMLFEKCVYSVSEIVRILDAEISRAFGDIYVEGEVADYTKSKNGHIYFKLKDEDSSIKVVIFKSSAIRIEFKIENGMLLIVRGKIGLYEKNGDLQIYATYAEPSGIGALQMKIEQAKKNLQKDGLTDPQRKRKISPYPRRVGVVTSLEGAAIRDFVSVLKRRGANIEIVIVPSSVQGKDAPDELKKGLLTLYKKKDIDLIVITRGGGSMQDLMAFNDESLARLVAESPVPIISAIGHEIDTCLTDLTADLRAATPSAAAEIISQNYFSIREEAKRASRKIAEAIQNLIYLKSSKLTVFSEDNYLKRLNRTIERFEERVDKALSSSTEFQNRKLNFYNSMYISLKNRISPKMIYSNYVQTADKIQALFERIQLAVLSKLQIAEMNLKNKVQMISERSPMNLLARGYAIVKKREGKTVKRSSEVDLNEILKIILFEGELQVKVEEKIK